MLKGVTTSTMKLFFFIVSAILAFFVIGGLLGYYATIGSSICWKNTVSNIDDLKRNLDGAAEPFELVLDKSCVLKVVLTNERGTCSDICNSKEFNGNEENCLERCAACEGVENPESFIIAVPRISTSTKEGISQPGQEFRERFFNKINCKVSGNYRFADNENFYPEESSVFCLTFKKIGNEYFVTKDISEEGACNYG